MALQENLGIVIQKLRKQRDISQEKFALEAGIDRKYVSDIENGKRNPSLDVIERIAKYFYIPVSRLFELSEQISRPSSSLQQIKDELCERGCDDTIVLEHPDYLSAIIGISNDDRVIYSYDKMVEWLIEEEEMDEEEAVDFISYDTMRALPYAGEKAPIILFNFDL